MRTPMNTQAELIVKLDAESFAVQNQIDYCQEIIAKNAEGITMLEPFAEWGEEPTA
jgi:hypothetical protein